MLQILLVLFLTIFVYLYVKWRNMKDYWKNKGIPQERVHPIFGSLTFLQKKNPIVWLREIYNKHYGVPYVGIWVFWRRGLVINSPELSRQILIKDSSIFNNRLASSGNSDPFGALNLFTADDPLWSFVRKRLSPIFSSIKLKGHRNIYETKSKDLIYRINSDIEKGNPINLKLLSSDFTTDVIGESAFGIECKSTRDTSGPFRDVTKEFEKFNTWRGWCWSSIFFFPELVDIFGFTFWPKHTYDYFIKIFTMMVQERGGYMKKTDGKKDLLDALIKLKQVAVKDNKEISEDVLVGNALVFLQAGYETSSTVITCTLYELAYNTEAQQRLYEELTEAKHTLDEHDLGTDDIAMLPYFNACINETLRKFPTMGWLDRVTGQDYKVDDKLTIPAGTVVYVNAAGMHQDPKYFPDPEAFKPERWLLENVGSVLPFTFMPFGEGPRSCIGKRFGLNTVRNAVAAIIQNFELKPLPDMPHPNDIKIEKKGLLLAPGEILRIQFVPRKNMFKT